MTTQLLDTEIRYSRQTKDYDVLIDNQIVASAPNFSAAELIRSQLLSERIQDGCYATATELDGDQPAFDRRLIPAADWGAWANGSLYTCGCGNGAYTLLHGVHDAMDIPLCVQCHTAYDTPIAADAPGETPAIDDLAPGSPPDPDPAPGRTNPVWRASSLIGVCDLHRLAQTDPSVFRARLAALSDDDLKTQATLYALYASLLCDREIGAKETLEHFRLSVAVHHATQRSEDRVCHVLYELALTDAPAMIEFLRAHTAEQRAQLAERFSAWLKRECEITREAAFVLRGWSQLCVGAAASGLQVELANHLGYVEGWDAMQALWRGADACTESYASL